MGDSTEDSAPVAALWFDREGCGPDSVTLALHPFAPEIEIPATLGLRIRKTEMVLLKSTAAMVDGGFLLSRPAVAELHRQLGAWLGMETP